MYVCFHNAYDILDKMDKTKRKDNAPKKIHTQKIEMKYLEKVGR